MAAIEPLYRVMGINTNNLNLLEKKLLEANLIIRIYTELKEHYRNFYRDYFYLMRWKKEEENNVLDNMFASLIVKDILSTHTYTVQGIAYYTDTPEDVVNEVIEGHNTNPSFTFVRKMIELHFSIRKELYHAVTKKLLQIV